MTIYTKEQIEALMGSKDLIGAVAYCLARTALALHQQLADAQAAQALVVERAAETSEMFDGYGMGAAAWPYEIGRRIRALADPSGVEALAALRELLEAIRAQRDKAVGLAEGFEAERDALAAKLAAAEARVEALVTLLKKCRPPVANMAYGWPEDDALVREVDAALTTPAEETKG